MEQETTFRGTFPCVVDQKRRLTVPSRFARALTPRARRTFVAVHGLERCLSLYPLDFWRVFERNLQTARFAERKTRRGIRRLVPFAEDLVMDNQNRLTLTPALLDHARIKHDAVLVGMIEHLELWSPQNWDDFLNEEGAPSQEDTFESFDEILRQSAAQVAEERERSTTEGDLQ